MTSQVAKNVIHPLLVNSRTKWLVQTHAFGLHCQHVSCLMCLLHLNCNVHVLVGLCLQTTDIQHFTVLWGMLPYNLVEIY